MIKHALLFLAIWIGAVSVVRGEEMFVYFGTHSAGPGKGFSIARFDTQTGSLTKPQFLIQAKEPAFFIIHPDGKRLYTCNSGAPGGVSAYSINGSTGELTLLSEKSSGGGDPSFVSLDKTNKYLFVANYNGGNIAAFAIAPDGSIGAQTAFVQHTGKSVHPQRQGKPFAHAIITDPTNRFVLVPDLGIDKVMIYRFDEKTGSLAANDPPAVSVKPGSGPRHVRFHPNGKWVYLINEMGSSINLYDWDSQRGVLGEQQSVSTLPDGFAGTSTCAELEVHPNGRFVYGSNRGHDSIAVFAVDTGNGKLSLIEHTSSKGKIPRNFAFDPSGEWMLCTNHGNNVAVVFRVNQASGKLTPVGEPVEVPSPFCERFLPIARP